MRKIRYSLLLMAMAIGSVSLLGCQKESEEDTTIESLTESISEVEYEWVFSETENKENAVWESYCEQTISDIQTIECVTSVELSPTDYDEYLSEGKMIINCTTDGSDANIEDTITTYVEATNFFEEFEVVIE